jgi:hypothetical protein
MTKTLMPCEKKPMPIGQFHYQKENENVYLFKNGVRRLLVQDHSVFGFYSCHSWVGDDNQQILNNALNRMWNEGIVA